VYHSEAEHFTPPTISGTSRQAAGERWRMS